LLLAVGEHVVNAASSRHLHEYVINCRQQFLVY